MTIILKYSEMGLLGEKEVEERKYYVDETLEGIKDVLKKWKRTTKKTTSKTLCCCNFVDLKNAKNSISVLYDTYDNIDFDVVTVYFWSQQNCEKKSIPFSKAAKYILEKVQEN